MARRAKVGKARKDKYYYLAKQQGYRARSALKLIQLARKCDIFSKCNALIDLCAAPGGWLQVARQRLPSAVIVGVDLAPIAPIQGVTTIRADITTEKCFQLLRREIQQGQCDVVLHDGAPNVGADWSRDAFVQNELVLYSLKLATHFLRRGGIFVSKVFRSRDWVSLLWVFEQLFNRVTPTKPSSSRDVSAEIFVICEGFKAPASIDPKFFDVRHVFIKTEAEEMEAMAANSGKRSKGSSLSLKTMMQMADKKNRSGYESDSDVYRPGNVVDFFHATGNGAAYLTRHHTIAFPASDDFSNNVLSHKLTTDDVKHYCKDLRVCGLSEKRALIKWREKILVEWGRAEKAAKHIEKQQEEPAELTPEEQEALLQKNIIELHERGIKNEKKLERKEREKEKKKMISRAFAAAAYGGGEQNEPDLFSLNPRTLAALEKEDEMLKGKSFHLINDAAEAQSSDVTDEESEDSDSSKEGEEEDDIELVKAEEILKFGADEAARLSRVSELAVEAAVRHDLDQEARGRNAMERLLKKEKRTRRQKVYSEWATEMAEFAGKLEQENLETLHKRAADESSEDEAIPGDLTKLNLNPKMGRFDGDGDDDDESSDGGDSDDDAEGIDEDEEEEKEEDEEEDEEGNRFLDVEAMEDPGIDDNDNNESAEPTSAHLVTKKKKGRQERLLPPPPSQSLIERFFDQPLFKQSGVTLEALQAADNAAAVPLVDSSDDQRPGRGIQVASSQINDYHSDGDTTEEEIEERGEKIVDGVRDRPDSELPSFPQTDKEKRRLKRQRDAQRRENTEDRKRRKQEQQLRKLGEAVVGENTSNRAKESHFEVVPAVGDRARQVEPKRQPHSKPDTAAELAEIHAIGALLSRRSTRLDLVDGAYHRYAFDDDAAALPAWLVEDEAEAMQPELPVTRDVVKQYRQKWREIEARPIRKVMEAKGRKQKRLKEQLERVRKKAEAIAESPEFDEKSKTQTIRKMMSKIKRQAKPEHAYQVMNKRGGKVVGKTRHGGKVKLVDKRLKKDKRAEKAARRRRK